MDIRDAIEFGVSTLSNRVPRPRLESEILLSSILHRDRIYLFLNPSVPLSNREKEIYIQYLQRRREGEPIEYITNRVSFYNHHFFIDKGALIPRPETEILVDKVLEAISNIPNPKILEIGTGSGAVAISIAIERKDSYILAVDISNQALQVAKKNIELFQVSNIEIRKSNLFQNIQSSEEFDIIFSNPPYISVSEKGKLQRELDYEPDIALFGGERGDEVLKNIIDQFFIRNEKVLICEMGYNQRDEVARYVDGRGRLDFYKDFAKLDRGFILKK